MLTEENKAIARRWFEEGMSAHNLTIIDKLFAADFVEHTPFGSPTQGREALKQLLAGTFAAMPDLRASVEDVIAEGDKVTVRLTTRGTQTGDFMGIPATGKLVTTTNIEILRFEDGKIAETWLESDVLGMMRQPGVIPTPGQIRG